MKALIVDDEPTVRLLLSRILQRELECSVTEATNGIEALDLLSRQQFDFVVIDVIMPLMDGLETLEAIRATPALKQLPVLVLSAVRDEAQVRQLVALGVSAYLTKPLRPSDASTRIQRFVATLAANAQPGQQATSRTVLGLPDRANLLVVDGDADFRHFVHSTLGMQYDIAEADGGAQGLRTCLEQRPAAILLGQNLGAVPAPIFVRKLRSVPALARIPVVIVGARGADIRETDVDGIVQRTFVAEAFRAQFARLVAGAAAQRCVLGARPELRPQMISATEQVFGMMLGIEVFADAVEQAAPGAGADLARVPIALPHEDSDLEFGLYAERTVSERMTALFLHGAEVVTEDDVSSTLREVVQIISGRLQNALRAHGEEVRAGTPSVERFAGDAASTDAWTRVAFANAARDVRFVGFLRPVTRVVEAEAAAGVAAAS